jgi:hypothetical protein
MEERTKKVERIVEEEKHIERQDGNVSIKIVRVNGRLLNLNPGLQIE